MDLRGIGIWSGELRYGEEGEKRDAVAELEELGYTAAWIPDVGGDVFGALRDLLDATTHVGGRDRHPQPLDAQRRRRSVRASPRSRPTSPAARSSASA